MHDDKLRDYISDHREEFSSELPPAGLWDRIDAAVNAGDDDNDTADPLRSFIATHRDAFDTETPPPRLADRLFPSEAAPASPPKLRVSHRRRRTLGFLMGIAASLLLLLTAYHFGSRAGYRASQDELVAQQIERMDPELAEAERFYRHKISTEFTKVSQVNDDPQLLRDLEELDRATTEIRAQLIEVPASQRPVLVNQLIETYRTKLEILLRIQQHFPTPNSPAGVPGHRANPTNNEI